jgi:hypothetical protein
MAILGNPRRQAFRKCELSFFENIVTAPHAATQHSTHHLGILEDIPDLMSICPMGLAHPQPSKERTYQLMLNSRGRLPLVRREGATGRRRIPRRSMA